MCAFQFLWYCLAVRQSRCGESHGFFSHRDPDHRSSHWPRLQWHLGRPAASSSAAAVHPTSSTRPPLGQQEHFSLATADASSSSPVVVGFEHSALVRRSRMGAWRFITFLLWCIFMTDRPISVRPLMDPYASSSSFYLLFFPSTADQLRHIAKKERI